MKRILTIMMVVAALSFSTIAGAQTKIGYLKPDDILRFIPELAPNKVNMDTVGQKFVQDSIVPQITYTQNEYKRKLIEYSDSTKPAAVRKQIEIDLQDLKDELDGASPYVQQVLQYKLKEFLDPYYAKIQKATEQVAKEKGYTHVLNSDVFMIAPPTDDLSLAVLAKLGIKLPEQKPAGTKPAGKSGN